MASEPTVHREQLIQTKVSRPAEGWRLEVGLHRLGEQVDGVDEADGGQACLLFYSCELLVPGEPIPCTFSFHLS